MSFKLHNNSYVAYTTTSGSPNVTIPAATAAIGGTGFKSGFVLVSDANAALLFSEIRNHNLLEILKVNDAANIVNIPYTANPTLPAASLVNGSFDLGGQTTALTVTFDTAANIYAILQAPGGEAVFTASSGSGYTPTTFTTRIFNNNTASGAITLAAGTGNTLTGVSTIAVGTGVKVTGTVTATSPSVAITLAVSVN